MFMYNKKSFEKSLKKRYQEKIIEYNQHGGSVPIIEKPLDDPDVVDDALVKQTLSFEMMMQLSIYHSRKIE